MNWNKKSKGERDKRLGRWEDRSLRGERAQSWKMGKLKKVIDEGRGTMDDLVE